MAEKLEPKHPNRIGPKALDYLREVVEYGFGNSSGPDLVGRFEKAFAKRFGAEKIQPWLFHFKTNYLDLNKAQRQANILKRTIAEYSE